ncbi:MAG: ATP-binding protein [Bacteroidales bacterium]|jgi:two-component system NtrC family sensor kinase|nr:ATP-binding protein [Bacteroidales bacterium]
MKNSGTTQGPGGLWKRISKYFRLRSTIYGRVVGIITVASLVLFFSFSIIFRTLYVKYFHTVLKQNGNNMGAIVEGSLYQSMLENDKRTLHSTLDIINTMPGIEDVNLYDQNNYLAYSSFSAESVTHSNPDCISCHTDLNEMFSGKERSYIIIDEKSDCSMNPGKPGQRHLLIRRPILNEISCYTAACHAHTENDEVLGSLIIRMPLKDLDNALQKSSLDFLVLALVITAAVITVFIFFTRKRIKDPLHNIIAASEAVSAGEVKTRLAIGPGLLDDMKMVSTAFNNMLDHIDRATNELENWSKQLEYKVQKKSEELSEVQNELINVERIASLGKLSASVAHEINNPLSGILIYTKLIYKQLENQDLTQKKRENVLRQLKLIETETKRCGDIVKGLLDFSRKDQDDFEERNLNEIVQGTYELMMHHIKIANISLLTDLSARLDTIWCSPNQIKQACIAILVNASEAVSDKGEIIIRTMNTDETTVRLEISDNGSGIAPDDVPHIFEPFFTTKRDARGTGLGLAIVHGIVTNHKGKIEVDSAVGRGTTISLIFPLRKV